MQVIACQFDIAWEDKPASHRRLETLLEETSVSPGALVVLPEMCATGFSMNVDAVAESLDGPTHAFLAALARRHGAFVLGGVVTRAADGRGRNEAVAYDPAGTLVARYAKMHPFSFAGEPQYYQAGDKIALFDWQGIKVAPLVCYDLRFPEVFRHGVRAGAELFAVIANWPRPRASHWSALLAARAIENQAYVVGVNRTGSDPHVSYAGQSLILDPRGELLAAAGDAPQALVAEIEKDPLVDYRARFPALSDLRPDLFQC